MRNKHAHAMDRSLWGAALGLIAPAVGAAGVALGKHELGAVNMKETRNVIVGTALHTNPGGCTRDKEVMMLVEHPGQPQMLATVLAAKATKTQIDFTVDGCVSAYGATYPIVTELTWE